MQLFKRSCFGQCDGLLPILHTIYCLLPIVRCILSIVCCLLFIAYCVLLFGTIAYCLLPIACCQLPSASCLMHIAYCLLQITYIYTYSSLLATIAHTVLHEIPEATWRCREGFAHCLRFGRLLDKGACLLLGAFGCHFSSRNGVRQLWLINAAVCGLQPK